MKTKAETLDRLKDDIESQIIVQNLNLKYINRDLLTDKGKVDEQKAGQVAQVEAVIKELETKMGYLCDMILEDKEKKKK